ncbi:hypothetical protein ACU686_09380 [Yinghuangia aomiensis]
MSAIATAAPPHWTTASPAQARRWRTSSPGVRPHRARNPRRGYDRRPCTAGRDRGRRAGWQVWPRVVAAWTPEQVGQEVSASGLRGRGGAGFPVAEKWAAARRGRDAVVVANGDEGDPGSYADRLLMEYDPDRVLEGVALACFACGAREAVILVRSEYPRALARMREAAARAYADGHLGAAVHGGPTALEMRVVEGAGSYVAGRGDRGDRRAARRTRLCPAAAAVPDRAGS